MPWFKITDRVTYDRTWIGEAVSAEQAEEMVSNGDDEGFEFSEQQDGDGTCGYEVEEIDAPAPKELADANH